MSGIRRIGWIVVALLAIAVISSTTEAHETDQYTIPAGRETAELGPYLNARFYNTIVRGVNKTNERIRQIVESGGDPSPQQTPDAVAAAVNSEFPIALAFIEGLDAMALSEKARADYPGRLVGYKPFTTVRKYADIPLNPLNAWGCASIKVYGVNLGTDKVGHFTDMGMFYYRAYRAALRDGLSEDAALQKGIALGKSGPISEQGVLGWLTAGAYSNADLVANTIGMMFYKNLTDPVMLKGEQRPPMLQLEGNYWRLAPHVREDNDFFAWFISEHYDEALNPSLYLAHMRSGIRKAIREHATSILARYVDEQGNRRQPEYFTEKAKELRTYWGLDYGHAGRDEELITIAQVCYPAKPDGQNPAARDETGLTPLHHAAMDFDRLAARRLIAAGADVNAPVRSNEAFSSEWGNTPLHYAAGEGDREIVELLIGAGADVNAANDRGVTPLHRAAPRPEVIEILLRAGAVVDRADARGRTPLHIAASIGRTRSADLLLQYRANVAATDREGRTPLHLAADAGQDALVEQLIGAGADANCRDRLGVVPLHLAASRNETTVRALLANGAAIDAKDVFGRTALHDAARTAHDETVMALLRRGASVDAPDAYGFTPLHVAGRFGHAAVARALVEFGANVQAVADSRRTPIDEARRSGHDNLATLLQSGVLSSGATVASHIEP